jgi:hypothetical protein
VNGFHVKGMPQDEGYSFTRAQICEPVPSEYAFDRDNDVIAKWCDYADKPLRVRRHVPVYDDRPGLVQDADVHRPGMQIDTAVVSVTLGVESHWGLLLRDCVERTIRW